MNVNLIGPKVQINRPTTRAAFNRSVKCPHCGTHGIIIEGRRVGTEVKFYDLKEPHHCTTCKGVVSCRLEWTVVAEKMGEI